MHPKATHLSNDQSLLIRDIIDDFFTRSINHAETISPYYKTLWTEMHRLIGAGGKRLRPRMTVLAYEAFGGLETETILPIASAQELLHVSMLIHDDIIDRDYVRYGVDNVAGGYDKLYEPFVSDKTDRLHYAHSTALLAGDLLLSGAFQLMTESATEHHKVIGAQQLLSNSIFDVVGGELLDTEAAFREFGDISAETVARYKTASYTFVGPLQTGAFLADIAPNDKEHLQTLAENLGIAYQLVDDIISIFGSEAHTGKSTIGDIREGKRTYMIEQFCLHASKKQRAVFDKLFGDASITLEQADTVKELLVSSGARQRTEKAIMRYEAIARKSLAKLKLAQPFHDSFSDLITSVTRRDK